MTKLERTSKRGQYQDGHKADDDFVVKMFILSKLKVKTIHLNKIIYKRIVKRSGKTYMNSYIYIYIYNSGKIDGMCLIDQEKHGEDFV